MAKKQSRKELMKSIKAPDEYQKFFSRFLVWMKGNTLFLWATIIPIVLIMAGLFTWQWYSDKQEWEMVDALGDVRLEFTAENRAAVEKREKLGEQLAEVQKKIDDLSKPAKPGDEKPKKLTAAQTTEKKNLEKSRDDIEKQMNDIKPDHSKSLASFRAFFEKHSDTPQGWMAGHQAASILLQDQKLNEAKDILTKLLKKSEKSDFYQVQARFTYVGILQELNEYDTAMTELSVLEKKAPEKVKPLVLLTRAKILTQKGDKEAAGKELDRIQSEHANSPEAEQAKTFKAIVKGV